MIDLVVTNLTHPRGPPWTLETLGDPWRPLATLGDMLENDQFPPKYIGEVISPLRTVPRQKMTVSIFSEFTPKKANFVFEKANRTWGSSATN